MTKRFDRLGLLSTFARIAERGSISAAARDLGLSQASASRQLSELEQQLGVQLIHRTTHTLALTEAGEDCLVEARELLEGWEAMAERYAAERETVTGKLNIIAPVALGQLTLADAALDFQQQYPQVEIRWRLQDEPIRFAEIGCDLWIKVGAVPDDTLVVRPLGSVERLVTASPLLIQARRPRRPADLETLPCAALEPYEGGRFSLQHRRGTSAAVTARVAIGTNNIFSTRKAALRGIGYAILPHWFIADDLAAGKLVDLLPAWRAPSLPISAAYLPSRRQTRRLRFFIEHIAAALAAMPGVTPA